MAPISNSVKQDQKYGWQNSELWDLRPMVWLPRLCHRTWPRGFAGVIKVTNQLTLNVGADPGLPRLVQCNHKSPLRTKLERFQASEASSSLTGLKVEGATWDMVGRNECWQLHWAWTDKALSPRTPAPHLCADLSLVKPGPGLLMH